jgi:hypothetical protein
VWRAGPSLWAMAAIVASAQASGSEWVMLDRDFHREGDRSSLRREGPWARFTQRWGAPGNGRAEKDLLKEEMAVNCLTGAWGVVRYPHIDPATGKSVDVVTSLAEIEQGQGDRIRLSEDHAKDPLYSNTRRFACDCPKRAATGPAPETTLRNLYERYVAGPMQQLEFHVKFVRVGSEETAKAAIRELNAGVPIEELFKRHASLIDKAATPRGDLGFAAESAWTIEQRRALRSMKTGEHSQTPLAGVFGWEVFKLEAVRTIPAPTFEEFMPHLRAYATRAEQCGWAD